MTPHVLTLNAGSSSIKFALFEVRAESLELRAAGEVEGLGGKPRLLVKGEAAADLDLAAGRDHDAALGAVMRALRRLAPDAEIAAVGHRIVHGGLEFDRPVLINDSLLVALAALEPLAPLHQPHNLAGVRAARAAFPHAPQVACFDTAFHRGHDFVNDTYGLPREFYREGVRRYGFHGLSYEYIARRFAQMEPQTAAGRVVVAHLGNGASACGLVGGRSAASSMGFSTLDGLAMGTRPGQTDPGVLLYLMQAKGLDAAALTDLLYKRSGLKGLSGLSNDMRDLEASPAPEAREAVDYFIHRLVCEIGALAAAIGGLDALVFTGGIGEHSSHVRGEVMRKLAWLGMEPDESANRADASRISAEGSTIGVYVVPANEELMIAEHAARVGLGIAATSR